MRALVARIDNTINPIVVKELRQAVNGRFVSAVLILFLLISVVSMGVALMVVDGQPGVSNDYGQGVLMWMNGVLIVTCLLFLPTFAAARLAGEWSDTNTDLYFITTIKPRAIVWGKVLATALLAVLIYSACMPFMMLTFLLRGVDLPTIAIVLVVGFMTTLACIQFGVFAATLTTSRGFRVLIAMGLLMLLGNQAITQIVSTAGIIQSGIATQMDTGIFWAAAGSILLAYACVMSLFYAFSVAMISPPTSNRAVAVRLNMLIILLINLLVLGAWAFASSPAFTSVTGWATAPSDAIEAVMFIWLFGTVGLVTLQMFVAVCEREHPGDRVRKAIPRNPLLRPFALVLFSGGAGGMVFAWLLMAISVFGAGAAYAGAGGSIGDFDEALGVAVGMMLYAYGYAMSGMLIRKYLLSNIVRAEHTWSLGLVLAALGCALPPLLAYFVSQGDIMDSPSVWMLPNPYSLGYNDSMRISALIFVGVWSILVTIGGLPWYIRQVARFSPLREAPADPPAPTASTVTADA